jgi:alkylated DNA repair dioxygenase AlkB
MTAAHQLTFFDQTDEPTLGELRRVRRIELSEGAWVDVLPGWLAGSDVLLDHLLRVVPWRAERRQMYDRVLDTPRLLCWYSGETGFPHPVLAEARELLTAHYAKELREPFVTAGLCLYRDGRDSVAWHGDRIGRGAVENTMVAILSVGSARHLMLRPRRDASSPQAESAGGGATVDHRSIRIPSGHGDLLVMGGSCQRTWEHAIPKTAQAVGPRVSIQFRPVGVA